MQIESQYLTIKKVLTLQLKYIILRIVIKPKKGNLMNLERLKAEMPYKWRIQSQTDYNARCVAYVDSRLVQDRLDEVVGPENWQCDYKVINNNMYAGVAIRNPETQEWIWKWDCGTESNTEKEKGEASDAFKRAAVKWGVGRFLYSMPLQQVKIKKHTNNKIYPCDDSGNILWDGDALTEYINKRINGNSTPNPEKYEKPTEAPTYSTPNKPKWSKKTQDKAAKLEKDGQKGSKVLLKYLPEFNKAKSTEYKIIQDLDTDEKLEQLIKFVEELPPEGLI